jgi:hypothetical protein
MKKSVKANETNNQKRDEANELYMQRKQLIVALYKSKHCLVF